MQGELQKTKEKLATCVANLREKTEAQAQTAKALASARAENIKLEKALAEQWDTLQSKINQVGISRGPQPLFLGGGGGGLAWY